MRTWICAGILLASSPVIADDATSIHVRRYGGEREPEPLLHLDATMPLAADAEGGFVDRRGTLFELGPRTRFGVEGAWWQTGLAPSMFASDLRDHGWRAAAELSYDLGPFSVGVNASLEQDGSLSHRAVGLFAFRRFRLSRWMHAWILVGVALEQFQGGGFAAQRTGVHAGLSIGTTFK